ncbi:MAG TPA: c-type cytochrome [Massilibacterium sp.]|nr:c-type cytochrome [Massilibacterium sp.]
MKPERIIALFAILIVIIAVILTDFQQGDTEEMAGESSGEETKSETLVFDPPSIDDLEEGPVKDAVQRGHDLTVNTAELLPDNVGNKLSCISCHADAGLNEQEIPLVGFVTQTPMYRGREAKVLNTEDRINECFARSMNGKFLDPDGEDMRALVSYFNFIAEGVPMGAKDIPWRGQNDLKELTVPDVNNGQDIYQNSCLSCHGDNGQGTQAGPPVFGPDSYNDGAGLARLSKLGGFIQRNMPKGAGGSLSEQEAIDVAAYILMQERPEYAGKDQDWPKGGKPADLINKEAREQIKAGTLKWEDVIVLPEK